MSILFNGSGQYVTRSSPAISGAFSATWWCYQTSDLNTYSCQWMLYEAGGGYGIRYVQCGSGVDGTSFLGEVHESTDTGGGWNDTGTIINQSLNTWYFWGLTVSALSGAYTLTAYGSAAGSDTFSSGNTSGTWSGSWTQSGFRIGADAQNGTYASRFAGRISAFKLWDGVLTADQIRSEKRQWSPVLWPARNYWRLDDTATLGLADHGQSGHDLTLTGSPTAAEGAPSPIWRRKRSYFGGWSAGGAGLDIPIAMHHYLRQMGTH